MHKFLIHYQGDHVGVAVQNIKKNETVIGVYMDNDSQVEVIANHDVPIGHKIAVHGLKADSPVLEYGTQIGVTVNEIKIGDYVHTHNIKSARWSNWENSYMDTVEKTIR